jgi:hypothetical protein
LIDRIAPLEENVLTLLAEFTAGDPMREGVLWTNLSRREISRRLAEIGTPANGHTVRKLLKKQGLGQRQVRKKKSLGTHPDRDAQFKNIAELKFLMSTSRAGIMELSHNAINIGKLFLDVSLTMWPVKC